MTSQKSLAASILVCLFLNLVGCGPSHPPPHDYNYTATVLLNKSSTGIKNQTYQLKLPFSILFQGGTYNSLWFSTDSVLSFGQPYYRSTTSGEDQPSDPPPPDSYIGIAYTNLMATTVLVRNTSTNVTIEYCGNSEWQHASVCYILTYYDSSNGEMFDIDISQNNMLINSGMIITKSGQLMIDTKTVQLLRYHNTQLFSTAAIIGIAVGGLVFIAAIVMIGMFVRRCGCGGCCSCNSCCSSFGRCMEQCCCCLCRRRQDMYGAAQPSSENLAAAPTMSRKDLGNKHKRERHTAVNDVCSICLQPGTEVQSNCYHQFHLSCLRLWEQKSQQCPNCKQRQQARFIKCSNCGDFTLPFAKGVPLPRSCDEICCPKK